MDNSAKITKKITKNSMSGKRELAFYEIMNYPIPKDEIFFSTKKASGKKEDKDKNKTKKKEKKSFSRENQEKIMKEYTTYIKKYKWLYKSLPFIKHIYLCNSISFNALQKESDIDVCIVAKKGTIWRARFFSVLFFKLLNIKRGGKNKIKKFCLSFYITENKQNLYDISLPQIDIYLAYWLAHLIPIYQEEEENIYTHNQWISEILPNFPMKHVINIGTTMYKEKTKTKKILEKVCGGITGRLFEKIIKTLRLPIVINKTNKQKENKKNIIVNDTMLKFHLDVRRKVYLLYKMKLKEYK